MSEQLRKQIESELTSLKNQLDTIRTVNNTITDAGGIVLTASELLTKHSSHLEKQTNAQSEKFEDLFKAAETQLTEASANIEAALFRLDAMATQFKSIHSGFEKANIPGLLELLGSNIQEFSLEFSSAIDSLKSESDKSYQKIETVHKQGITSEKKLTGLVDEARESIISSLSELEKQLQDFQNEHMGLSEWVKSHVKTIEKQIPETEKRLEKLISIGIHTVQSKQDTIQSENLNRLNWVYGGMGLIIILNIVILVLIMLHYS